MAPSMQSAGRPREFDETKVLKQSMLLFWQNGYRAVSIRDLEAATAMTASSLYNRFGSKEGLFAAALKYYLNLVVDGRIQRHLQPEKGLQGIRDFFTSVYRQPGPYHACLMTNTWSELGKEIPTVTVLLEDGTKRIRHAFKQQLNAAISAREISAGIDVEMHADLLLLNLQGLLLTARAETNKKKLDQLVEGILLPLSIMTPHTDNNQNA